MLRLVSITGSFQGVKLTPVKQTIRVYAILCNITHRRIYVSTYIAFLRIVMLNFLRGAGGKEGMSHDKKKHKKLYNDPSAPPPDIV